MTTGAEGGVVDLIFHQQIGLRRGMRLMARHAVDLRAQLGDVGGIDDVGHRMSCGRMSAAILQRQHHDPIFSEVIIGEFHAPIHDRDQVFAFEFLRSWSVGPVAFQAQRVRLLGAQQMIVLAAVRLVTDGASLLKCGLMKMRFLELGSLIAMAGETGADRVRVQEARSLAAMRIVASDAFSQGPGMRHLGLLHLLGLIAVTRGTERPAVSVGQYNFAVFRGLVTDGATPVGKWRMHESLHQLGLRRLMRIVALRTGGRGKRLSLVGLDERGVLGVVAVEAERGDGFGQVIVKFLLALFSDFMDGVAGVASHVESGVAAAFFGDIQSLTVAIETEVFALRSRSGFQ